MPAPSRLARLTRAPLAAKVPEIALVFWVVKVLTTGMGEALSDYLANLNIVLAIAVGVLGVLAAVVWQLRARRYRAFVYWTAVAAVAVFGTMAADGVHLVGLPYAATTACYVLVVAALFLLWHRSEGTLSIHSITSTRRELFYWATVLATFALGTAVGDFTADELGLGYLTSALLYAAAIAVPALAWRFFRLNATVAFWSAYVLTRPLGASFADWFGKPSTHGGGLGYGDGTVAAVVGGAIVALVAYLAVRRPDIQPPLTADRPDAIFTPADAHQHDEHALELGRQTAAG
jgi:uncharacterized membrane-anchored protein